MKIILPSLAKLPLKTKSGIDFFELKDIIYIFIESSIVKVQYTDGNVISVFHTLSELEFILTEFNFYRIHSAYLINLIHIQSYSHKSCTIELSNKKILKVACYRRVDFNNLINSTLPPPIIKQKLKRNNHKLEYNKFSFATKTVELIIKKMELAAKTMELTI